MTARRTLRFRITVSVVGVLALVIAAFSVAVYAAVGKAFWHAFDERLHSEAKALAGMVDERTTRYSLEREGISALPEFAHRGGLAYFQLWAPLGAPTKPVIGRSRSLGSADLPFDHERSPRPKSRAITLPDGRPGRLLQVDAFAQWKSNTVKDPPAWRRPITVVVARDTADEEAALANLRNLLLGFAGIALLVAAAAAAITVARGLRPARAIAATIGKIDEAHLGQRIEVPDLPRELEPPVAKLNALLARLQESFARERRFTADVSHELRTPLAGLRSLLEVAMSRQRSAADYREMFGEAIGIVRQMHGMVENLLMLARVDARQIDMESEPIALRAFVDECWKAHAGRAAERGLAFDNEVDPLLVFVSDRDKLRLVVSNLLSNAAEYTEAGGRVFVRGGGDGGVILDVCDSGPTIPEAVLPRLFERFYRADAARSGGVHCGIGLALVESLCSVLRLAPSANNMAEGGVRFRLTALDGRGRLHRDLAAARAAA